MNKAQVGVICAGILLAALPFVYTASKARTVYAAPGVTWTSYPRINSQAVYAEWAAVALFTALTVWRLRNKRRTG